MRYVFVAVACAALVACVLSLELPDVKDHPDQPIDAKQIKNATLTFYNNGTYIYMLEAPCDAYLSGRGGQQRAGQQQTGSSAGEHDEEDVENEDDVEDANGQQQLTPQQRQRQQQQKQQQQRQRQQQQQQSSRGASGRSASSGSHHHDPEELRQAHAGTECECHCKGHDGETLDDVVTVSFGGKGNMSKKQGGQRQQQQSQRSQQQRQQQQQARTTGGSSSQHEESEGPQLVYPAQPRPGQKCIFFEEGEWENDDDELIEAAGPDNKVPGEPEDEVLEKCTFNFKKGGAAGQQQASLRCVDNHGEQDQYVITVANGELKPKLTPQQKQEQQKQKQKTQGRTRNQ